jgi:hypothetical protein
MKLLNPLQTHRLPALALAAALLGSSLPAWAQDESADEAPRQALNSEIMPLATKGIINDVARRGSGYVAVGERGHILLSDDAENWEQVVGPTRAMLNRVQFVDEQHGWAVGYDGAVLKTADGGQSWTLNRFEPAWGKPWYDLLFADAQTGLVAGANGRMLATQDGGESWTAVENDVFETGFHHYDVALLNDGSLLIAGERGFLARSTDDGCTWEMLQPPYIGSYFGILPHGPRGAVVYGLQGRVFAFDDVTALPTVAEPLDYDPFSAENVTDPQALAAMGWRQLQNPVEESLFGATMNGSDQAVFVGVDGSIVRGELSWQTLEAVRDWGSDDPLSDIELRAGQAVMTGRGGFYSIDSPL